VKGSCFGSDKTLDFGSASDPYSLVIDRLFGACTFPQARLRRARARISSAERFSGCWRVSR